MFLFVSLIISTLRSLCAVGRSFTGFFCSWGLASCTTSWSVLVDLRLALAREIMQSLLIRRGTCVVESGELHHCTCCFGDRLRNLSAVIVTHAAVADVVVEALLPLSLSSFHL